MRALELERLCSDKPKPLDQVDGFAACEPELFGDTRVRLDEAATEHARVKLEPLAGDLLGEAAEVPHRIAHPLRRDERSQTVTKHDQVLLLQQLKRLANGHHRHAVALRQLPLGSKPITRSERSLLDLLPQIAVDPEVMRCTPLESVHSLQGVI